MSFGETMVLLDESIERVDISVSNGVGEINDEVFVSYTDKKSIQVFESVITNAREDQVDVSMTPDYDLVVSYGDNFPSHAIYVWLGEAGEESVLSYLAGDGETYVADAQATEELRALLELE